MASVHRRASAHQHPPISSSATQSNNIADKILKSRWSDQSLINAAHAASTTIKTSVDGSSASPSTRQPSRPDLKRDIAALVPVVYDRDVSLSSKLFSNATALNSAAATSSPAVNNNNSSPNLVRDAVNVDVPVLDTHAPLQNTPSQPLADELDYITIEPPSPNALSAQNSLPNQLSGLSAVAQQALSHIPRSDKASRILGIQHRKSMEPIPASVRTSIVSTRSARDPPPSPSFTPTLPLTSLYVVSGLPKSPHTWTLADPDSALGLNHSDGAVNRWWRPEVLGSTVSPGAGGGKKKKKGVKGESEVQKGAGALSKQEVGKMLSKALKLSFTREVEIIASTLQPASTIHTFTFTLPAPSTPLAPNPSSNDLLRASLLTTHTDRSSAATFSYPYADDPFAHARPSSAYLGPPSLLGHSVASGAAGKQPGAPTVSSSSSNTLTYHGVCLTVWSHADGERSTAIRRTLEAGRARKESGQSAVASRLKSLRADAASASGLARGPTLSMGSMNSLNGSVSGDPTVSARKSTKKNMRGPWTDIETDAETEGEGAMSESEYEVASTVGHGPGESTLFLPGDTVFWLPYALTLVSRHPIYDLMRDYLTLSWARFSKDVQSHTLQISKILSHPAPRAGDLIKLDASAKDETNLEVIARFPGGLDFGRGLVDINFTMWPLFKALNIDNILTICEIALAPTGRILFFSRHPAILGIAVSTIKYLVELRGWNGIALPAVHSRDAKIYIDDPGPWIMGLATEARYSIRPAPEVCVCDLDINYLSCPSPPPGVVSSKQQRERYRQRLLLAFEPHYHPDHCVPSEFKEAFPAGRFRPVCKIQAKRGASTAAVADTIKPPEWWHSTRIIQAFDAVLQDRFKKPSLFRRISSFGQTKRPPQLTAAEQLIQLSIRKRATAFVDARDDLETKIGRLSRRLNFLMTESDLWRDKFVTFEQYAEKLSVEANQLRTKINKEQKETKRLSGLVTLTATEKTRLQSQLVETEKAHKDALIELEKMKETMDRMEQERAEMVAEVEAQIERALASMAVDVEESDYGDYSRPGSRSSSRSTSINRSRRENESGRPNTRLRSVGTESTLVESYEDEADDTITRKIERETGTIEEEEEETPSPRKKRFSATQGELLQDGMTAVDEGISERSDKIAQKVLEIQKKLETALATDARVTQWKNATAGRDSDGENSDSVPVRARPPKGTRLVNDPPAESKRMRSDTGSSTQTGGTTPSRGSVDTVSPKTASRNALLSRQSSTDTEGRNTDDEIKPQKSRSIRKIASNISLSATSPTMNTTPTTPSLTPAVSATTDDSDTEFLSAYSASPRDSYGSFEGRQTGLRSDDDDSTSDGDIGADFGKHLAPHYSKVGHRERVSSTATTVQAQPSPTLSVDTVVSTRGRSTTYDHRS